MKACSRLRSLGVRPRFHLGRGLLPIGATGDADREAAMRTERSSLWGFDDRDLRLEVRRAAAKAQRDMDAAATPDADDPTLDDLWSTDWEEWELPGGGRATGPMAPAISRR
jgi:hypothetical protein